MCSYIFIHSGGEQSLLMANGNLEKKWNITDYKKSEIFKMVSASCEYLKGRFSKKEGSWGVAPFSSELVSALKKNNICADVSICENNL